MKTCSKCKKEKPFSGFSKSGSAKDGLKSQCKVCAKAYRKAYYKTSDENVKNKLKIVMKIC